MFTMWIQSFRVYYMPDPPVFQAVHEVNMLSYCLVPCCHDPAGGRITVLLSLCAPVDSLLSDRTDTLPKLEQQQHHQFSVCSGTLLNICFYSLTCYLHWARQVWSPYWALLMHKITFLGRWSFLFSESGHVYPREIGYRNKLFTTDHSKCGFDVEHTSKLFLRDALCSVSHKFWISVFKKSVTRYSCHCTF